MIPAAVRTALGGSGAPRPVDRLRSAVNWVNLTTPLGIAVARLGGARVYRGPRCHLLAEGYRPRVPVASAFCVGDVLVSRRPWAERVVERPQLMQHEAAHSWQYVATLGLPFVPLYLGALAWSWARTGDTGARNVFEQLAGLQRGGYPVGLPTRALSDTRAAVTALVPRARR